MAPRIEGLFRDLSIRRIRPGSSLSFPLITSVQNPVCSSLVRSRNKPGIAETAMFKPAPSPVLARSGSRTREIKRRGRQALQAPLDPGGERRGQSRSLILRPRARCTPQIQRPDENPPGMLLRQNPKSENLGHPRSSRSRRWIQREPTCTGDGGRGARGRSNHCQPQCTRAWGATSLPASISAQPGRRKAHAAWRSRDL